MNPISPPSIGNLGDYLKEQRQSARLSVRQLAQAAGISNPYLSQIERGLRKPSAEILQQLATGLRMSAETLYVRAGILQEHADSHGAAASGRPGIRQAVRADPRLNDRQRQVLLDVYASLVGDPDEAQQTAGTARSTATGLAATSAASTSAPTARSTSSAPQRDIKTAAAKTSATKSAATKSAATKTSANKTARAATKKTAKKTANARSASTTSPAAGKAASSRRTGGAGNRAGTSTLATRTSKSTK